MWSSGLNGCGAGSQSAWCCWTQHTVDHQLIDGVCSGENRKAGCWRCGTVCIIKWHSEWDTMKGLISADLWGSGGSASETVTHTHTDGLNVSVLIIQVRGANRPSTSEWTDLCLHIGTRAHFITVIEYSLRKPTGIRLAHMHSQHYRDPLPHATVFLWPGAWFCVDITGTLEQLFLRQQWTGNVAESSVNVNWSQCACRCVCTNVYGSFFSRSLFG